MPEPIAAINGRLVPWNEASISILDDGLVQGATVTERIRTFARQPFRMFDYLQRLKQSLEKTGIADPGISGTLEPMILEVLNANQSTIPDWEDFAIVVFVTPGWNRSMSRGQTPDGPTVCIHTLPVTQPDWARLATDGVHTMTPSVQQLPREIIDPGIKHRSRLHWYLANREASRVDADATALLRDDRGYVTETSSGNLIVFDGHRLLTPKADRVLGGLSLQFVSEMAAEAGLETDATDLTPTEVIAGKEAFLSSTGYCLLPVTRLNGQPVGTGHPGPLYQQLMRDWSQVAGIDILGQFEHAAATAGR